MEGFPPLHPWVDARRHRVTFALNLFPALGAPLVELGRQVEALGFDALYVGDHPGWHHDCWLQLAVLAGATERLRVGPMVTCVAYRLPVVTARLAADLDGLSGGRLVLGLGIGWDASQWGLGTNEFARLGLPYPPARERQAALEEAIAIIRGVWAPQPLTFMGRYYTAVDVRVDPPPLQRPGPPLVIAGAGEKVTLRQVARFADACNFGNGPTGGVATLDQIRAKLAVLRRHCEEVGRPEADVLRSHFTAFMILAESETALRAKLARYFPDGLEASQIGRLVVAGTPAEAVGYYQGLVDAGMQHLIVQMLDANDDETIRLLAHEVMPKVCPLAPRKELGKEAAIVRTPDQA